MGKKYLSLITEHLKETKESYWEHCYHALKYACTFLYLFVACLIHAFIPCFFMKTARLKIEEIKHDIIHRVYLRDSQKY